MPSFIAKWLRFELFLAVLMLVPAAAIMPVPAAATDGRWTSDNLIRTPTARQPGTGTAVAGVRAAGDMRAGYVTAVPLEGVAVTVRRVERPLRSAATAADLELVLTREGRSRPQIVAGMLGLLGAADGAASAYAALSRRWWALDLSFGLGGGRFSDPGGLTLPWSGMTVAPFGGVAWQPMGPDFAVEVEYDPRGIAPLSAGAPGRHGSLPANIGLSWRPLRWLDLSVALVRGQQAEMRAALLLQPPPERRLPQLPPRSTPRPGGSGPATAERRIARALADEGMPAAAVRVGPAETTVWVDHLPSGPPARLIGRVARMLSREAPPNVERFEVVLQPEGLDGASVSLMRRDLERAEAARGSPAEIWRNAEARPVKQDAPALPSRWTFALRQRTEIDPTSSGPSAPLRLTADLSGRWRSGHWLMSGAVRFNAPSRHPEDVRKPVEPNELHGAWVGSLGGGWHLRHATGILEEAFAGHSTEILYRPSGARWAAGLQGDLVFGRLGDSASHTERAFLSTLASAYLETPDALGHVAIHGGRYLAGDPGITVELSRTLSRGLRLGAHATLTEATQGRRGAVFGLSLGVPLGRPGSVPLDVSANLELRPSPDGAGRRLERPLPLYEMTTEGSYGRIVSSWPQLLD